MKVQPHIRCAEVFPFVLVSGDPGRIERMASFLERAERVSEYRGYKVMRGFFEGVPVSLASTGIGSPSAAIAVEELIKCGARTIIRVGTCGSLIYELERGDMVIPTEAIRGEGTTSYYAGMERRAKPSPRVKEALLEASRRLGYKVREGKIFTTDAFYINPPEMDAIAVEMECSAIFLISEIRGVSSGAILTVDSNLKRNLEKDELSPEVREGIDRSIRVALKAIKILSQSGQSL